MLQREISRLSIKGNQDSGKFVTKLEQDFELGESLGAGGFGEIIKAKRKCDNNEFAIKIIRFDSNLEDITTIRREADLLSKLNHNNIVRYYNSWTETAEIPLSEYEKLKSENSLCSEIRKLSNDGLFNNKVINDKLGIASEEEDEYEEDEYEQDEYEEDKEDSSIVFESDGSEYRRLSYLFIQMELCENRSLRTEIDNNLYLDEDKLAKYFKEICEGLAYIHKYNIVHRDLKPENIFLTRENIIKIGDFGLSKQIQIDNQLEEDNGNVASDKILIISEAVADGVLPYGSLTEVCGTAIYIAPEMTEGKKFNVKADIYSLGVIYFEMCSQPMTVSEKITIFPLTFHKWKLISFQKNNNNKRNLIKMLLQMNHHERPTCEDILSGLNSLKSMHHIKDALQQSRNISHQEWKMFENVSTNWVHNANSLDRFLSVAAKIFQQHGGQHIPMPTFVPSVNHLPRHLTTLLNTRGNSTSVSNTSKIPFCYYLANNDIKKIRRYSMGKAYEEGQFAPNEIQECLFEAVSPNRDDNFLDAEMMRIAEEVKEVIRPNTKSYFVINHGSILLAVLKRCGIFCNSNVLKALSSGLDQASISSLCFNLKVNKDVKYFLLAMTKNYPISGGLVRLLPNQENLLRMFDNSGETFSRVNITGVKKALNQLKVIEENARKFGVKSPIYIVPLYTKKTFTGGFMFKMVDTDVTVATGGRFHSLIKNCCHRKPIQPLDITAVDLSFDVENILKLISLYSRFPLYSSVDVVILADDTSFAIPLYQHLLSKQIKCDVVQKITVDQTEKPSVLVIMEGERRCRVFKVSRETGPWATDQVFRGNWKECDFERLLSKEDYQAQLFLK